MDKKYRIMFTVRGKPIEGPQYSKDLAVETFLNCKAIIRDHELTNITVKLKRVE